MSSTFSSLVLFTRYTLSAPTAESIIALLVRGNWHFSIRYDDGIDRARCVAASAWYRDTDDDKLVMIDNDIVFKPEDIERLVARCGPGYEIVCGDYSVHNAQFRASQILDGVLPDNGLLELKYAAAGCMAIHRSAIEALVPTLPLCHKSLPIAFWPFFMPITAEDEPDCPYLTEDYAFTARVRAAGKSAWLDPQIKVGHLSIVNLTLDNMAAIFNAANEHW